jgi:Zn-dependent protease
MGQLFANILDRLKEMLYVIPALLIAFPVHELSHGLTAYALGDKTAKRIILVGFGWAKPVPVNPNNFKNPKGGMAITALSGPLSNLILGFVSVVLYEITNNALINMYGTMYTIFCVILQFFYVSAVINIGLCLFNLIPIPPLDGQKIISIFLPDSAEMFFERYAKYFQILIIIMIMFPSTTDWLQNMVTNVLNNMDSIVRMIIH